MFEGKAKLDLLERTILELGTELFNLKGMVGKTQESHEQLLTIMKGLKQLLDEKGLITRDDFDAAVELGEALELFNTPYDDVHHEAEKSKKQGH